MAEALEDITLVSLLPFPYLLIYAIPLLLAALTQNFAGAFLTLDRTSTFAPQGLLESVPGEYTPSGGKSRFNGWWVLEGGVGGLASGWVFGIDLATFLSLLILNRTSEAPLTPVHFLVIHLVSSLLFTFLCGRFKFAALACTGIAGGASIALTLIVVLHPTLLTRLIFVAILTPLSTIAALLPVPRTQHWALRAAASSAGAFGSVVAIALLAHVPSWGNVWERLWLRVSVTNEWGTAAERGLSAAACVMLAVGIASDWALRRIFGENPDQKWDAYLAHYAATLPNANERAGTFQPVTSLWQRIFHPVSSNPIIFPSDFDLKSTPPSDIPRTFEDSKARTPSRKRVDVKFQPLGGYSDSDTDSDSESELRKPSRARSPPQQKGWLLQKKQKQKQQNLSASSPKKGTEVPLYGSDEDTRQGSDHGRTKPPKVPSLESYLDSDAEQDLGTPPPQPATTMNPSRKSHRDEPGWKPGFLLRHELSPDSESSSATAVHASSVPSGAVPMTPSLIRAIDRIAVAQSEANGYTPPPVSSTPPSSPPESGDNMKRFWDRVQQKVLTK